MNKNQNLPRRHFLRGGLIGGAVIMSGVGLFVDKVVSAAESRNDSYSGLRVLIHALRSTNNAACLNASYRLEEALLSNTEVNLHLRNADLKASDAETIAEALLEVSLNDLPVITSFSMSYNPDLTDAGVVALAKALPRSLSEVGFVDCNIGDDGGAALLQFSQHAAGLRMICLEGNRFSEALKRKFAKLSQARAGLMVIV